LSVYFVDTSALAKRYIPEKGRQWLLSWILPKHGHVIVISHLAIVEVNKTFATHYHNGHWTQTKVGLIRFNFLFDADKQYLVVPMNAGVITTARQLVYSYRLRSLDAIQLASAVEAKKLSGMPVTFVAGDKNLQAAAVNEGFIVEDPHNHPSPHDI
jgi:predicted nucleic acid-binding protein